MMDNISCSLLTDHICSSPCNNHQYQSVDYSKCITPPSPLKDFKELQLPPLGEVFPTVGEAEKQAKLAAERQKLQQLSPNSVQVQNLPPQSFGFECRCENPDCRDSDVEVFESSNCRCDDVIEETLRPSRTPKGSEMVAGKEENYDAPDLIRTTSGNIVINRVFFQDRVRK